MSEVVVAHTIVECVVALIFEQFAVTEELVPLVVVIDLREF